MTDGERSHGTAITLHPSQKRDAVLGVPQLRRTSLSSYKFQFAGALTA